MNKHWVWRQSISLHSDSVGEHGGGLFTGDFEGEVNY